MSKKFANNNSAVEMTKLGYTEETRNLDFRVMCGDLENLKECVSVIDNYNEFSARVVNTALDKFAGLKDVSYYIGRESSVVMYFDQGFFATDTKDFDYEVEQFAKITLADECNKNGNEWRLWWD